MKSSYKLLAVNRTNDINIDWCSVRFFEGDITTEDELDFYTNELKPVTRYRPTKVLGDRTYTSNDFGEISSDEELLVFLNKELINDKTRTPVETQAILDVELVK